MYFPVWELQICISRKFSYGLMLRNLFVIPCHTNQGESHTKEITKALKMLEEQETNTLGKIANIEACMDHMEEEELQAWIKGAQEYVQELATYADAGKECKRVQMGWLNGLSSGKDDDA